MANATIDTLQVKITANATDAAKALNTLTDALKRVRDALGKTGKDGQNYGTKISRSLTDMSNALSKIDSVGVKRLNDMAVAMHKYASALNRLKGTGGIAKDIRSVQMAITAAQKNQQRKPKWKSSVVEMDYTDKDFEGIDEPRTDISVGNSAEVKQRVNLMGKLSDAFKKLTERFKEWRKETHKSTGIFSKFIKSIGRIALYRAIRSALKAVGEAFSEGLKNAYQYSKQSETFQRLAETLDHLKSVTAQMINQLGAFWGEFKQFIQPAVTWLIEKIRQISEWLTELFAALNGEKTYLQAQYVAQEWEEAADAVDKYKHQLLGLDELNNLSANNGKKKDETDYSKPYKEVEVSAKMLAVGEKFQSLKQEIEDAISDTNLVLLGAIGTLAIGAILLFTSAHKLLGLGMMISSGLLIGESVDWDWETLREDIKKAFKSYRKLITKVAVGLAAIGMILLFIPTQRLRGISMIIASGVLMAANVAFNWTELRQDIKQAFKSYKKLITAVSVGIAAIGTILLFIPTQRLRGISMLIASGVLMAANIALNWDDLRSDVETAFQKFAPLFAAIGVGSMVCGILLLFTGHIAWGLSLLIGGGFLTAGTIAFNWDGILTGLQNAWIKIKQWWNSNVKGSINKTVNWLEKTLGWDVNGDGKIAGLQEDFASTLESSSSGKLHGGTSYKFGDTTSDNGSGIEGQTRTKNITGTGKDVYVRMPNVGDYTLVDPKAYRNTVSVKAAGGVSQPGSLFYAGERGPEFVGSIGKSSAIANTSQMTDAIYKAAYAGMSQALRENGGSNGLAGFEPATGDDVFLFLRKKAYNYTKATGNLAY